MPFFIFRAIAHLVSVAGTRPAPRRRQSRLREFMTAKRGKSKYKITGRPVAATALPTAPDKAKTAGRQRRYGLL